MVSFTFTICEFGFKHISIAILAELYYAINDIKLRFYVPVSVYKYVFCAEESHVLVAIVIKIIKTCCRIGISSVFRL